MRAVVVWVNEGLPESRDKRKADEKGGRKEGGKEKKTEPNDLPSLACPVFDKQHLLCECIRAIVPVCLYFQCCMPH